MNWLTHLTRRSFRGRRRDRADPGPAAGTGRDVVVPGEGTVLSEVSAGEARLDGLPADVMAYLFAAADASTDGPGEPPARIDDPSLRLDPAVRAMLADKLARLLPGLNHVAHQRMYDLTVRALDRLARDEVSRVREALAQSIKDIACAPPAVCRQLAMDVERSVAEPMLNFCATLSDQDLLAIIASQPGSWALAAIAGRQVVSGPVSTAIYETGDVVATGVLLDNHGAEIPEPTLHRIMADAESHPEWRGKLARRTPLPTHLAEQLAAFVDRSAIHVLRRQPDMDAETARDVVAVARRRVDWLEDTDQSESAGTRAKRLFRTGALDDAAIDDALSWRQIDFVRAALALKAQVNISVVDSILRSGSARTVTALAWKAGLGMRTAVNLQRRAADIPPRSLLNARDGSHYPLSNDEMGELLALFGIK